MISRSSELKLESKSLDDTYNGETIISFIIQCKNTVATTIAANITLNDNKGSSVLSDLRDSINNYTTTTGVTLQPMSGGSDSEEQEQIQQ